MPLAYFSVTRLAGLPAFASWIMIYPVPVLLSLLLLTPDLIYLSDVIATLLAMLAVYSIYELGYMDNDSRTVALESEPTERLTAQDKAFWRRWRLLVILVRGLFTLLSVVMIGVLVQGNPAGTAWYLLGLAGISVVFPIYNSTRGRINLPLHFLLVTCRFAAPGMILVQWDRPAYLLVMALAFPLPNLLERAGEARYGLAPFAPLLRQRHIFRIGWYGALTLLAMLAWQFGRIGGGVVAFFGYWLAYRVIAPLLVRSEAP